MLGAKQTEKPGLRLAMTLSEAALLLFAGLAAGGVNAIAGGGTFFTFPAMLAIGLPPVMANASSAVAVWPGHAMAIPAYWQRLRQIPGSLALRCLIALLGGLAGAALLLLTGDRLFAGLVPWLLLFATLLFAFGARLRQWLPRRAPIAAGKRSPAAYFSEFLFTIYGGYFGAGLGVLLLASLSLLGHDDLQEANALKNLLATVVTSIAVVAFAVAGAVHWPATLITLAGAVAGGYLGARLIQRISAVWLRRGVIAFGSVLTLFFFYQLYWR